MRYRYRESISIWKLSQYELFQVLFHVGVEKPPYEQQVSSFMALFRIVYPKWEF